MGGRGTQPVEWHVWIGDLGCSAEAAACGPGSVRDKVDLLPHRWECALFRLRNASHPCGPAGQSGDRCDLPGPFPALPVYACALHDSQRGEETRAGDKADCAEWRV